MSDDDIGNDEAMRSVQHLFWLEKLVDVLLDSDDVAALMTVPYVAKQLNAIDPNALVSELKEYGAWDDEQLSDHEENKSRILWIAGGNIREEM